ncbi:MAG: AmmeMemoRadiSam system protein B [Chlorobi bacterium]|nr:AmmeMemoRadiSam system protein B [Chlorobiota bacterium]
MIRRAGNRGKFYPSDGAVIEKMILQWNAILDEHGMTFPGIVPEATVCPHAGYVYSGFTANTAHRLIPRKEPLHVLVVGPSHHVYIDGMSLGVFDGYETPFGTLAGDPEAVKFLRQVYPFTFAPQAHFLEHSTETQFPFLKYYNPDVKVTEVIYGTAGPGEVAKVIAAFKQLPRSVVVVSTDLSHYYPQEEANKLDAICIEAVKTLDVSLLDRGCEACGKTGLAAVIQTAALAGWKSEVLDYRTSGDVTGDYSAVVGYMSAAFYE